MADTSKSLSAVVSNQVFLRRLVIVTALFNLVIIMFASLTLYEGHVHSEESTRISTRNISQILDQSFSRYLHEAELGLLSVKDEYEKQLADGRIDENALNDHLNHQHGYLPQLDSIGIADESGVIRYGIGVDRAVKITVTDRDYFVRLRDDPRAGMVVSEPVIGKISKKWGVILARRLNQPDGSFAGVVYGPILLETFNKLFAAIDMGTGSVVVLLDQRLGLVARHPANGEPGTAAWRLPVSKELQQLVAEGRTNATYYTPTGMGNVARLVTFRKLDKFPFFIAAGISKQAYLEEWRRQLAKVSLLVLAAIAAATISSVMLYRIRRNENDAIARLRKQDENYRIVADNTFDWEFWLAPDGTFKYSSPSCLRITGHTASEFYADPLLLSHIVHPDDHALFASRCNWAKTGNACAESFVFRIIHVDGSVRWLENICSPVIDDSGLFQGTRGSNCDITERKLFEDSMRKLFLAVEQSPVSIVITDLNGNIEYVNPAFCHLSGYSAEEALGKNPRILKSGMTTADEYRQLWETITAGDVWCGEFCNKKKIDEYYWEKANIAPVKDSSGVITHFVAIKEDITRQKMVEKELEEYRNSLEVMVEARTAELNTAKEKAEAANRAKTIFLTNMSHEFRTPLNAVLGFAGILERDASMSPQNRDKITTIINSGNHLLSLVDDVLEMSRLDTGRLPVSTVPFDLPGLLEDIAAMCRLQAEAKGLDFGCDFSVALPRTVMADQKRLRKILIKLMENALRFTTQGSIWVRAFPADAGQIVIEVRDTGIGMDPEKIEKLFLPFEQADAGLASHTSGIGLGLSISRAYARQMGGDITVTSAIGSGSCFHFSFRAPGLQESSDSPVSMSSVVFVPDRKKACDIDIAENNEMRNSDAPTLDRMPGEWRSEFSKALSRKSITRIRALAEDARVHDPELSVWLQERIERYELAELNMLLQKPDLI